MGSKPYTIAFLDISTLGNVENLPDIKALGEFTSYELTPPELVIERLQGIDIVITNKVEIDRHVLDACPGLKLICIAATGMNNVDLDYAKEKGVEVKNVAGYSTESVAQSVFAMLFYLLHKSSYFDHYVKSGEYASSRIFTHLGKEFRELKNKRFGIIGLGSIGRRVAEIAEVFGSVVVYHSTSGRNLDNSYQHLDLNALLRTSDIVSVHCPLNEKTENLLGIPQLKLMKPSAYLINVARGEIVNESALAEAIDNDWIAGAGVDVLTEEPITPDHPLMKVKNKEKIYITPHIAWTSMESRRLLIEKIAENIREFVNRDL